MYCFVLLVSYFLEFQTFYVVSLEFNSLLFYSFFLFKNNFIQSMKMLTIKGYPGRFGNQVFRNLAFSYISKNNNINIEYDNPEKTKLLGFELFIVNNIVSRNDNLEYIGDDNFMKYITDDNYKTCNFEIKTRDTYCQSKEFVLFLYEQYYNNINEKKKLIKANNFKKRYNNNNDVFIHIRLGDVTHFNAGIKYYESIIKKINFDCGYISTDTPNHPMIKYLTDKYQLYLICYDEIKTIHFASTCKYLILSQGTFSWLIGFFGFYSQIYYPKIKHKWHGDIFVIPHWQEVDW